MFYFFCPSFHSSAIEHELSLPFQIFSCFMLLTNSDIDCVITGHTDSMPACLFRLGSAIENAGACQSIEVISTARVFFFYLIFISKRFHLWNLSILDREFKLTFPLALQMAQKTRALVYFDRLWLTIISIQVYSQISACSQVDYYPQVSFTIS